RLGGAKPYQDAFAPWECKGAVRRPIVPSDCSHNGHLYYLLFADLAHRTAVQSFLRRAGIDGGVPYLPHPLSARGRAVIDAVFHDVPLHASPAGLKFGRAAGSLPVTERTAARLLRLPVWA